VQDRGATRDAATVGVEEGARQARLATERAARMREEQYQERKALAEKRRLTFQQKVRNLIVMFSRMHVGLVTCCTGCRGGMRTGALIRRGSKVSTILRDGAVPVRRSNRRYKPVYCHMQEKRKRDMGMQKGGKGNYVEEEKRIARQHGVYGAGFD